MQAQLWPAVLGAGFGMAAVVFACLWLFKRWGALTPPLRWSLFAAIAVFETLYWAGVYAVFIEPRTLVVRHVEIISEDWRGAPLTIAVIADTHVRGPHVDAARMGRIVQRVNTLRPELVVLLGDYVAGHAPESARSPAERQEILGGIATFAALQARYGVVGVLGNHDSWYNRQSITVAMQDAGIGALWNRHLVIHRSGGAVVIAGLADFDTGEPSYSEALDGAPVNADTIILSHSPDPFSEMPNGPALILAAHSHCGQVTIPFIGRPVLPIRNHRYACHLVEEGGKHMYVTGGVGTSILPARFLNPPEIVLVRIRSGARSVARTTIP